jgi:uncharacterized protein DUF4440
MEDAAMLKPTMMWTAAATIVFALSGVTRADGPYWNDADASAIRAALAEGYETNWNSHHPAESVTPDRCSDPAIFINTTGGWVEGCQAWADMIGPLHAAGGPFHDHTRRHVVEELRFVRPDIAIAVVRTFDIKRGGVSVAGEETRGLSVFCKENGHWKLVANENNRIQANAVPTAAPQH